MSRELLIRTPFKPLWRVLLSYRDFYPVIIVYSICVSFLTLATPISVQSLVSTFSFGAYFQPIFILSLILLALLAILGLVKSLQYLMVEYLQRKLYAKITAIIGMAYQLQDGEKKDLSLARKANRYFDIILIHKSLAFLMTDGITVALQTFLGLILISFYHPFFIVFGGLILLSIVGPIYFFGIRGLKTSIDESNRKYDVADYLEELAARFESGESIDQVQKTDEQIGYFLSGRARHFKTLFTQNILYMALYAFLNALLLALGGYLVIENQLTLGQLVAAEIVVNAILSHLLYAMKYLESFYDLYAATYKVSPFFEVFEELAEKERKDWNFLDRYPPVGRAITKMKSLKQVYTPTNYRKLSLKFGLSVLAITLTFIFVPWQQFSRGRGSVVALDPNDRVQTITAPLAGIVEEWLVQDGQTVKKGEPIVRVVDNDPNYLTRLEAKRDAAVAKFEAAKEASDTGRLNYHRQEKLNRDGLSSSKEFEQAKIRYKQLRAEESAAAANLAKAEVELSRQQQQTVVAPRDGRIRRIQIGSGQTKVKAGDPLVEFVPDTENRAVELYADANDLPLVHSGRKVRLQFEGWPAVQFTGWPSVSVGSFGGVVTMVDPSVDSNGQFRILVKPDPEDPEPWPDEFFLRQGTRVLGIINLDVVTAGYEVWRQINGFPKSMDVATEYFNGQDKKK